MTFIDCYNNERPHQALGMRYPAGLYRPSARQYHRLADLDYPFHDRTITVTQCGRLCMDSRKINLSTVFAGQNERFVQSTPPLLVLVKVVGVPHFMKPM